MIATILFGLRIALSIFLYVFLLSAFWALWSDIRIHQKRMIQNSIPAINLKGEEKTYHFTIPEITIGRAGTCNCILNDNTVSAQHSLLVYRQGQWWLSDTNSTNGTFINEIPVESPTVLRNGDLIRCGQVTLNVEIESQAQT